MTVLDVVTIGRAVAASWGRDTAGEPGGWSLHRPSHTQCDASSFVLWEYLGDLVLGRGLVDGEVTQHHDWNRIDGADVDLTADQFEGHEAIGRAAGRHVRRAPTASTDDARRTPCPYRVAPFASRRRVGRSTTESARNPGMIVG